MSSLTWISLFIIGLSGVICEVIEHGPCDDVVADRCAVHSVTINPCKEAATGNACKVKRGKTASISFDFTPDFDASELEAKVFWVNGLVDVPFMGMENNGCLGTQCPVAKSTRQTYNYNLAISPKYPKSSYTIKWRLSGGGDNVCCFIANIKITK